MKIFIIVVLAVIVAAGVSVFFMRGLLSTGSATPAHASEGSLYTLTANDLAGEPAGECARTSTRKRSRAAKHIGDAVLARLMAGICAPKTTFMRCCRAVRVAR